MGELQGEKKPEDKKKAEEGKKSEDTAVEEEKKPKALEEKKDAGKKEGGDEAGKEDTPSPAPPPPPPEEIILRVFMHCEGCARKVKRSLKGFDGVEDVTTDCRTHKVVIKGKKAAEDPLKVAERVQKKSGRKVELLIPQPSPKTEKKKEEEKPEEKPKPEKEAPVISVVLNVHMHCEACAQEIKKRILRMKGVQAADPDLKSSQVLVKGIIDPAKLVDYVYKRTGKHAFIVNSEPAEKKPDSDATVAEEKSKLAAAGDGTKADDAAAGNQKKAAEEKANNEGEVDNGDDKEKDGGSSEDVAACGKVLELKKNEFCYYPRYASEFHSYAPQLFSDENPNACSVM
ncbi:Heavy metal-associated isoprenylated plant protein 26 [Platanthera zijinensis]|uniref:Heavy metal-associated isoprenylated plant protein 26 n=1 Tax=Platanthera zijinensis TaxID=2320716 RepID=A0AAP0G7J1_9ASPA